MNKKIEPVDIRQTLQYTQQCILVLNPAWGPGDRLQCYNGFTHPLPIFFSDRFHENIS